MLAPASLKPLIKACFDGNVKAIREAVDSGLDVNGSMGVFRPLSVAAQNGHVDAVRYLLQIGARLNASDKDGFQAIHLASAKSQLEVVELLVSFGADLQAPLKTGWRVIHVAIRDGALESVKYLIEKLGVDRHSKTLTDTKLEPIHAAVMHSRIEILRYLIDELHIDVNTPDARDMLPIHLAAMKGRNDSIDFLASRGADLLRPTTINQQLIHLATAENHPHTVRHLVEKYNADPNDSTYDYRPIHLAALKGNL